MWIIYGKENCSYCDKAKELLESKGCGYGYFDINDPFSKDYLMSLIPDAKTVPQIFLKGEHIGGYQELVAYFE